MTDPDSSADGSKKAAVFFGQTRGQWLFLFACILAGIIGIAWLARTNETAREVLSSAGWATFTFFTTPFILEASVALLGLCMVIAWNNRRIEREGDDWVVMEVPDEPKKDDASGG
ncbi:MAG: hypothetical protein KDK97_01625 [Verrucomicrobiales bacterium]|nr:hypothetical protein [Verrucomicrobiales bacterium]MCP5557768.1 hypothetical protein [Verrucomicrobiaceae bacterium]